MLLHLTSKPRKRTLNIRHTLLQDLIQHLGIIQLLVDLRNDAVCQLSLLPHLDLTLVSHPGVQYAPGFGGDGGLLLGLVGLRLELRRLLCSTSVLLCKLALRLTSSPFGLAAPLPNGLVNVPWKQQTSPSLCL